MISSYYNKCFQLTLLFFLAFKKFLIADYQLIAETMGTLDYVQ